MLSKIILAAIRQNNFDKFKPRNLFLFSFFIIIFHQFYLLTQFFQYLNNCSMKKEYEKRIFNSNSSHDLSYCEEPFFVVVLKGLYSTQAISSCCAFNVSFCFFFCFYPLTTTIKAFCFSKEMEEK